MILRRLSTVSVALLACTAQANAAEIQVPVQGPVIELTVNETVKAKPDLAIVSAGVTTRAMTADAAARDNATRMTAIVSRLRQLGIAASDIQTSNFNLSPQFSYTNDGRPPRFLGYDVTNQVNATLRKIDTIGPTLDALIAAGANNFSGPSFQVENPASAQAEARRSAFASAQARARELAGLAGYSGARLLELSETYATSRMTGPGDGAIVVTAMSSEKVTPIEPGQIGISVTLTVKYEMTR